MDSATGMDTGRDMDTGTGMVITAATAPLQVMVVVATPDAAEGAEEIEGEKKDDGRLGRQEGIRRKAVGRKALQARARLMTAGFARRKAFAK
jgi:hypothetical protein